MGLRPQIVFCFVSTAAPTRDNVRAPTHLSAGEISLPLFNRPFACGLTETVHALVVHVLDRLPDRSRSLARGRVIAVELEAVRGAVALALALDGRHRVGRVWSRWVVGSVLKARSPVRVSHMPGAVKR